MNECPQSDLKKSPHRNNKLQTSWAWSPPDLASRLHQSGSRLLLSPPLPFPAAETTAAFHVSVKAGGRPTRQPAFNY